jgi:hypothetical protein
MNFFVAKIIILDVGDLRTLGADEFSGSRFRFSCKIIVGGRLSYLSAIEISLLIRLKLILRAATSFPVFV